MKSRTLNFDLITGTCFLVLSFSGCNQPKKHAHPVKLDLFDQFDISFDVAPNEETIVFNAVGKGGRDLYLLNLKTKKITQLLATNALEKNPRFSPDGKSILFEARNPGEDFTASWNLFEFVLESFETRPITSFANRASGYGTFLPDGRILFAQTDNLVHRKTWNDSIWDWSHAYYYTINRDGAGLQRSSITWGNVFIHDIHTKTNSVLVAQPVESGLPTLAVAEWNWILSGNSPFKRQRDSTATIIGKGIEPVWLFDGDFIAYIADHHLPYEMEVWLINRDNNDKIQLTALKTNITSLRASKTSLWFLAMRKNQPTRSVDLWKMDVHTRELTMIADYSLFNEPRNWEPKHNEKR